MEDFHGKCYKCETVVGVVDASDDEAVGTAELIEEVFTSSNPPLREHGAKVRLEGFVCYPRS
jgi:hypothetical protein